MWVLHREFCGPKSHPFRLPPLTETEAAKAWTDRHTVITDENGPLPDLVKMAQTYGGMSEEEFEVSAPSHALANASLRQASLARSASFRSSHKLSLQVPSPRSSKTDFTSCAT